MHGLDVIIRRNAEAAGREAAHAANDGDSATHIAIDHADRCGGHDLADLAYKHYFAGFYRGRQEG